MKIYKIKKNRQTIEVFTRKFIQFNDSTRVLESIDYSHFIMKNKKVFWEALRAAGKQLKNGEYISCFIIEKEIQFGWKKFVQAKQPYHIKVLSAESIELEVLKRNFI